MTATKPEKSVFGQLRAIRSLARDVSGAKPGTGARFSTSKSARDILRDLQRRAAKIQSPHPEPVRTLHHLSCTGGTLISKCVASMANTLVLNEIDMLSEIPFARANNNFTPTDLVSLLYQSGITPDPDLVFELFSKSIMSIRDHYQKQGQAVVLRDHAHSHFLYGPAPRAHRTMRDALDEAGIDCLTLLTVRNPVHSYHSMQRMGWHTHKQPSSFEEYCQRYLTFLEAYQDAPLIKYEEFAKSPRIVMKEICEHLKLSYSKEFQDVFHSFKFSGDSGRKSSEISLRPTLELPTDLVKEVRESKSYLELAQRLDYSVIDSPH